VIGGGGGIVRVDLRFRRYLPSVPVLGVVVATGVELALLAWTLLVEFAAVVVVLVAVAVVGFALALAAVVVAVAFVVAELVAVWAFAVAASTTRAKTNESDFMVSPKL
jgi:hypothetical protein